MVGGGWKVTLVSVCVHLLKLLDTQTHRHRNGHRAWQFKIFEVIGGRIKRQTKMHITDIVYQEYYQSLPLSNVAIQLYAHMVS